MGVITVDEGLLHQIDKLELSDRIKKWKGAMKAAPYRIFVDRQKYATESWKGTEGQDIQIRRAMLFKNVAENVEIKIHDFDGVVGRMTPGVIGAYTSIDVCGDYISDIWNNDNKIGMTMDASTTVDKEGIEILREAARTFGGKTGPDMANRAWEAVVGTWYKDAEDAKVKDPPLNSGIFGNTSGSVMYDKLLKKGLKSFIAEAQGHIDEFIANHGTETSKVYFWQSAIIVCQAAINLSRRYAKLARELSAETTDADRKEELLRIAETCEYCTGKSRADIFAKHCNPWPLSPCAKAWSIRCTTILNGAGVTNISITSLSGTSKNGVVTLDKAAEMLTEPDWTAGAHRLHVETNLNKETHQINFGINGMTLGGVDKDGAEASNELSYLFLHMVGLLHISSPTVGLRWNKETPDWPDA